MRHEFGQFCSPISGFGFIVSEVASIIPPQPLKAIIDCLLWASVYLFDLTYSLNRRGTRMAGL
jgi:hypothetical protein